MDITRAVYTLYRVIPNYGFTCMYDFLNMAYLSVYLASNHYDEIVIHCDKESKEVLEELELPIIFKVTNPRTRVWTEPKLTTYAAQEVPFVHLDFDVLLWDKLPSFEGFLYQNIEHGGTESPAYLIGCKSIGVAPTSFNKQPCNFGVFGTTDTDTVRKAYEKVSISLSEAPYDDWRATGLVVEQLIFRNLLEGPESFVLNLNGTESLEDIEKMCIEVGYTHLFDKGKEDNRNRFFIEKAIRKINPYIQNKFKELNYSGKYGTPFNLESRKPVYKRLGFDDY